jgi:hypothetical protein
MLELEVERRGAHKLVRVGGTWTNATTLEELDNIVLEEALPLVGKRKGGLDEEGDRKPFGWLWPIC